MNSQLTYGVTTSYLTFGELISDVELVSARRTKADSQLIQSILQCN